MGDTCPNTEPCSHSSGGVHLGYGMTVHQKDIGLDTRAPAIPWSKFSGVLIAARQGDDAALDAACADVWGTWWAAEVVSRGLRTQARQSLARYLPPWVAIP